MAHLFQTLFNMWTVITPFSVIAPFSERSASWLSILRALKLTHAPLCIIHRCLILIILAFPSGRKKSSRSGLVLPRGGACVDMKPARSLLVPAPNDSCLPAAGVVPGMRWLCQEDAGLVLEEAHRLAGRGRQVSCHCSQYKKHIL